MKKEILLLISVVAITLSSCMTTKVLQGPAISENIIKTTLSKKDAYIKANEWMVDAFGSAESVIQFSDKEAGIIKGKYIMKSAIYIAGGSYVPSINVPAFYAIITVRVKDDATKIEIEPIDDFKSHKSMGVEYGFTPEMFVISSDNLIQDFTIAMSNTNSNNW